MSALYVSTLHRAAEIVGGEEALALRLGVTPSHLALWLNGIEAPPGDFFLKAVDLISEHEMSELSKAKELSTAEAGRPGGINDQKQDA